MPSENRNHVDMSRLMMMIGLLLLFALLPLTHPVTANAHAPKAILLAYDLPSQTLSVTISHPSPSPTFHYIKRVIVSKDGKALETAEYKSQPNKPEFTYTYKIAAAAGDTLEVKATCNLFGSKTVQITVPKAAN